MDGGEEGASATAASTEEASPPPPSNQDRNRGPDEEPDNGDHSPEPAVQTDFLKRRIIKLVEYYFSDEDLLMDNHMISLIRTNREGFG